MRGRDLQWYTLLVLWRMGRYAFGQSIVLSLDVVAKERWCPRWEGRLLLSALGRLATVIWLCSHLVEAPEMSFEVANEISMWS